MSDGESAAAAPEAGQASATTEQVTESKPVDVGAEQSTSNPIEARAEDTVGDEAAVDVEGDDTAADESGDHAPRRRTTAERNRRKISYLAGVAERERAEKEELQRQLDALKQPPAPDPSKYEGGEYDPKFIRDSVKHEIKQESIGAAQPARGMSPDLQMFGQKAEAEIKDFGRKVTEFKSEFGGLPEHVLLATAKAGQQGPAVLNHILENPTLAEEILQMDPIEAGLKIGELRAAFKTKPTRAITTAPKVMSQVSGGASAPPTLASLASQSDDASAYVALRRQQRERA